MGQRLGQHFLKNPQYAEILVREAGVTENDIVLEIGPGEGMLTRYLLLRAKKVVVVEKDEALAAKLPETFPESILTGKLQIVTDDVRNVSPAQLGLSAGKYVLAANIPYYITGEILRQFLETSTQPRTIAFLVQKEVAQRIIDDKESILSISVKVYGTPRIAAKVSKGNFNPPPSVDSAILVVEKISKKNFADIEEHTFFDVVRTGFSSKRKLLLGNLGGKFGKEKVAALFESLSIDPKIRAENLHVEDWLQIARAL